MRDIRQWLRRGVALGLLAGLVACTQPAADSASRALVPAYDAGTGRLQTLSYDADHDGRFEMHAFMDGSRMLRVEVDENADGRPDRWEHYDYDSSTSSTSNTGRDTPSAVRIERAEARDGHVTRRERYERGALVSVEVDRDRNGAIDRWEAYAEGGLATVALDTDGDGEPDRRLRYDVPGAAVETIPDSVPAPGNPAIQESASSSP